MSKKRFYLDGSNGMDGGAFVEALLMLGADRTRLQKTLQSISFSGHENRKELLSLLSKGQLSPGAEKLAVRILSIYEEAKEEICLLQKKHAGEGDERFAADNRTAWTEMIAAAICLDELAIQKMIVTGLAERGQMPVPSPLAFRILSNAEIPVSSSGEKKAHITPSGAAIAAAICAGEPLPEHYLCKKQGMGRGKETAEGESFVRILEIEELPEQEKQKTGEDEVWKLECNVDDCTGEILGYCMERLLAAGARDVSFVPLYMKKSRPAVQINVICTEEKREELEQILFRETSTIGIRRTKYLRTVMEREMEMVETRFGTAKVKVCSHGPVVKYDPEYEDAAALARKNQVPLLAVYEEIQKAVERKKG